MTINKKEQLAINSFNESIKVKENIIKSSEFKKLIYMSEVIASSIENGKKLLICGNGGSAADAQHLAAELLVRLKPLNNREGIPAIALAMDSSTITACGNDFGYDVLFERMVETLGCEGDVLIGITTSGNSKNINLALSAANKKGITAFGFLGSGGGSSTELCDEAFMVPSNDTARIQESHITAGHILMELIENSLIDSQYISLRS
jgi:D-sedoheptulose 7-phosphate isomerase